jgi:hypothetical protein
MGAVSSALSAPRQPGAGGRAGAAAPHSRRKGDETFIEKTAVGKALAVLEEWRLAHALPDFLDWLEHDAPSDDAGLTRS